MNILRTLAAAAFMLALLPSQAQQLLVKPQPTTGLYTLTYLGADKSDLVVRILDTEGKTIHREYLEDRQQLSRAYRLTQILPGTYTFEVSSSAGKLQQTVGYPITHPLGVDLVGSQVDHRYQLQLDTPTEAEITVRIYDADLNLLHESYGTAADHANRVYNLSQLPTRSVTFSVASDYQVVERRVNLR